MGFEGRLHGLYGYDPSVRGSRGSGRRMTRRQGKPAQIAGVSPYPLFDKTGMDSLRKNLNYLNKVLVASANVSPLYDSRSPITGSAGNDAAQADVSLIGRLISIGASVNRVGLNRIGRPLAGIRCSTPGGHDTRRTSCIWPCPFFATPKHRTCRQKSQHPLGC